ncbi:MAG TPA: heavy metal-associated domain-containing protein [Tepidiformaceae bacterium]|jgi:copper chaperone|nr:heavy metal-associated domain-containing protein [Tepidiformaceae bacterium]
MATTLELEVRGMTCDHCVHAVTNALKEVPGVASASVDLEHGSATVEGDNLDSKALIAAIEEEGYEASPK